MNTGYSPRLRIEGLSKEDQELLEHSIENSKRYYSNPAAYDAAWKNVVDDDDWQNHNPD